MTQNRKQKQNEQNEQKQTNIIQIKHLPPWKSFTGSQQTKLIHMLDSPESPTKFIREGLDHFHLDPEKAAFKITSGKSESKNHLHIPEPLFDGVSKETECDESEMSTLNDRNEQDTVIHKTGDADISLADFMKVKLQMKEASSTKGIRPRLINQTPVLKDIHAGAPKVPSKDNVDDHSFIDGNTTWDILKRSYNIKEEDIYDIDDYGCRDKLYPHNLISSDFFAGDSDKSTFSFEEMPKIRMSGSTLHTGKVTSFQSHLPQDSPLEPPKLIKNSFSGLDMKAPIDFKAPVKLITPKDLSMSFDETQKKWIRKPSAKKSTDRAEVTSVTNLDISFSESKTAMISALTSTIKPNADWDSLTNIDLSDQKLQSLIGLSEFIPCLCELVAKNNRLTNLDGIPLGIKELNLSQNLVCDHLATIGNFKSLLTLDLSGNKISRMDFFQNLTGLKSLNLSKNKIKKLVGIRYVENLDISHNLICGPVDFEDVEFPFLKELNASHNQITSVNDIDATQLRCLNLSQNRIEKDIILNKSSNLQTLELIGNTVKTCIESEEGSILLSTLSIDGNVIVKGDLPFLNELYVQKDYTLRFLSADPDTLYINSRLKSLTVDNSGLTHENLHQISTKFPHLAHINLRNNLVHGNFTYLVEFLSKYGTRLKSFNIDNNPLSSYIKSEKQISCYEAMIHQIMLGNIGDPSNEK